MITKAIQACQFPEHETIILGYRGSQAHGTYIPSLDPTFKEICL